jgi:hypothetical protein
LKAAPPNNNKKETTTMNDTPKPDEFRVPIKLFDLGQTVATPGAIAASSREYMLQCLGRHISGDWGCIDEEAGAQEDGWTPEDFALWFGEKYGLTTLSEFKATGGRA